MQERSLPPTEFTRSGVDRGSTSPDLTRSSGFIPSERKHMVFVEVPVFEGITPLGSASDSGGQPDQFAARQDNFFPAARPNQRPIRPWVS